MYYIADFLIHDLKISSSSCSKLNTIPSFHNTFHFLGMLLQSLPPAPLICQTSLLVMAHCVKIPTERIGRKVSEPNSVVEYELSPSYFT